MAQIPESVIIIDDDPEIVDLTKSILTDLGVENIRTYNDGTEGWNAIDAEPAELIVLDWKLSGYSGLNIFNRLRMEKKHHGTAVLVISGFLRKDDFNIVSEYSYSELLPKPFEIENFNKVVAKLMDEATWFKENQDLIDALMKDLAAEPKTALSEIKKFAKKAPNPLGLLVEAAYVLRCENLLPESEDLLRQALEINPDSVRALSELGKTLHLQGRHKDALRILRSAHAFTPENLERLLLIGELSLIDMQPGDAKIYFKRALSVDPDNEKASAGLVSADNIEAYIRTNSISAVPYSAASLLNVIAISMVRSGQINEGLKQYQAALHFVDDAPITSRLHFNMGLAHMRASSPELAISSFQLSADLGGIEFEKAQMYIERLKMKGTSPSSATKKTPPTSTSIDYLEESVIGKSANEPSDDARNEELTIVKKA